MPRPETHNPFFFWRGFRFEAIIGAKSEYNHTFGDAGGFSIRNQPAGTRPPHQILTLDTRDPALSDIPFGFPRLPIFYDFHVESGHFEYDLTDDDAVSITDLNTAGYNVDWPYENYPAFFPVQTLALTPPILCDLDRFEKEVWQGVKSKFADHFIAIIPPSDAYGVDLWCVRRNIDDIHVKSFFDPATRHAIVYNECD